MKTELPVHKAGPAFNCLRIEELNIFVRLGCLPEERQAPQEVRVTIEFRFRTAPPGMWTDRLEDTICYAQVSEAIQKHCQSREYHLIEKIAADVYTILRELSGPGVDLGLSIHKVRPPVANLLGGTYFRCGDFLL